MYKINAIKISFLPQQTMSNSLSSFNNASAGARFFSAVDRNDATPPADIDTLRQYKSAKQTSVLKPHSRFIMKPKILDRGGTYTPGNPWVSCDAGGTQPYYGLKVAIEPILSTTTADIEYNIEVKYYLAFKNVK